MNKKNLILFSLIVSTFLSTTTTFSRSSASWAIPTAFIGASIIGSNIAASNAAERDRRYYEEEARRREEEARRRDRAEERRHREKMAAIRASQYPENQPGPVDGNNPYRYDDTRYIE